MFDAALAGLVSVLAWPAIGYLFLGVFIGLYFGAVPGLSGLVGMAILLPFTFSMDPVPALAFLLGMFAVTTTSDTIASVLLGIPGTAASQATILDGYPMAMKGEASRAFGAAFTVSAVGGLLGALVLGVSIPIVKPLILSFTQAEFFMLGLLGLAMVGSLSGDSMLRGLTAALIGLSLSFIGYAENGAVPRYWLGATYLLEGLPLIPVVLGLFALPEVIDLAIRDTSISRVPQDKVAGGMLTGIGDAARNWWLVLRSTAIGAYVGMLPGLGGSIVDWVAYGHVVQSSKDKDGFGKGDVRGVIAPETANNAMKGGALIPTVAFGIPGSASMAILLGALLIQGMTPGPEMLTVKLDVTFAMMWTLAIANVAGAILLMLLAKQVAKVSFIRGALIVPAVTVFVFMGAWLANSNLGDWVTLMIFGVFGYVMKQGGVPRPPMVLGLVIGPIMENALFITNSAHDGLDWLGRPICLVIAVLIALTIAFAVRRTVTARAGGTRISADLGRADPVLAVAAIAVCFAVFAYAVVPTFSWPEDVGRIPMVTVIPGIALSVAALVVAVRELVRVCASGGDAFPVRGELGAAGRFFLWWIGVFAVTVLAGQLVALPAFVFLFMLFWGRFSWWNAGLYAAATWLFLYVMFDQVVAVLWYPSVLFY